MMDELVFRREVLRRRLVTCVEMLEKAAAEYDPEEPMVEDVMAAVTAASLFQVVGPYVEMAMHRSKQQLPRSSG